MQVSYTPFLHAKDGEFCALAKSKVSHLKGMLPLFEVDAFTELTAKVARYKHSPTPKMTYLNWIADQIEEVMPFGPVMVDAFAWKHYERIESNELPVAFMVNALMEREVSVIPVVGLDRWDDPEYQFSLKSLDIDSLPMWALRLQTDEIEDAIDPGHFLGRIDEVLRGLGLNAGQLGLLVDFGDVCKKDPQVLVDLSARVLTLVDGLGLPFISIVGCSMPPSINEAVKKPNSQAVVMRKEMVAWRQLRQMFRQFPIVFGDYGVRGPRSSSAPNPNVNGKIRYTIENGAFIARGQSKAKDDGEQMYRLSQLVVSSPHYMGAAFSWGDQEIHRRAIREKKVGPGGANCWIKFDTSHHLAWVAQEVAAIEHELAATPALVELS
ncbi:beta family protein [Xanthomonas hortorum]|uniref:Beta family protein n=1 Tax=Xanthomonas hortorum pv. vitians TaxID=83224 RepID=A0A6V7EQS1_9XANT|nr:beta family protein [Xanthomonas hortorum]MCC8492791.1 beta family protein [Xanthomonas hortorum pv. gardneri]MCE4302964.1 beta family protein [Xanthomonas hortorum pv. vitians]MCE4342481.1 beta family protein [Xanthomonas hortorum pv. vitians]MCE4528792.1 beta family protein [Xanthomonas hortorum pv. vitians]MCE4552509.1 beta family protein [Xanthomonas hortorum pv. vitians]